MKAEEKDGYWYVGTNRWSSNKFTKEQAEYYADTLIDCSDCSDCRDCCNCSDCRDCSRCSGCSGCIDCSGCSGCIGCSGCYDCIGCIGCSGCSGCSGCIGCSGCSGCSGCIGCMYCRDCMSCMYCRDCMSCMYCRDCTEFKSNPQRITSPKIGSRQSQSTYYWTDEHEQVVCGCFRGTLDEFAEKVKEVHGDNQHGQEYMKWIKAIKCYKEESK